jgi:hypothetical protein
VDVSRSWLPHAHPHRADTVHRALGDQRIIIIVALFTLVPRRPGCFGAFPSRPRFTCRLVPRSVDEPASAHQACTRDTHTIHRWLPLLPAATPPPPLPLTRHSTALLTRCSGRACTVAAAPLTIGGQHPQLPSPEDSSSFSVASAVSPWRRSAAAAVAAGSCGLLAPPWGGP